MNPRHQWNRTFFEMENCLTHEEIQQILAELRHRRQTPPHLRPRRIISWLATLSLITLAVTFTVLYIVTRNNPETTLLSRLVFSLFLGYLTALQIMAFRFFQGWHKSIRNSTT